MAKKIFATLIVLIVLLLLGAIGLHLYTKDIEKQTPQAALEQSDQEKAATQEEAVDVADISDVEEIFVLDVSRALADRILGNPDAPIKISEHSSFTCGHCGAFHRKTFKPFKEAWIDSGRAYLVFSDFPLNAPALHASMIARCLPEEHYFDFSQMLLETQEDWAYDVGYMNYLKAKAIEYGLSESAFSSCLQSKELQEGILNRVRAAQNQWEIGSTPSFVINNTTTITGSLSFVDFNKAIEDAVNGDTTPVQDQDIAE